MTKKVLISMTMVVLKVSGPLPAVAGPTHLNCSESKKKER
jgi:hypothetical protein